MKQQVAVSAMLLDFRADKIAFLQVAPHETNILFRFSAQFATWQVDGAQTENGVSLSAHVYLKAEHANDQSTARRVKLTDGTMKFI